MEEGPAVASYLSAICLLRPRIDAATRNHKRRRVTVGSTDEYEETCSLGEGGFGAVVKARHRTTGLTVAIKRRLTPAISHSVEEEEMLREARFHEACGGGAGHPFIVGFHGLVRDPTTASLVGLVMECVEGPTLEDYLRQQRRHGGPRLPESAARAAMRQLLAAAKEMHGRNVVHRDIKPGNILVGDRVLKICDFGLAMSTSEPPPHEPAVGTLWYKAPEMLLEMRRYDERVDTWSLGCVMAEILYGRALFAGTYEREQLCAIFDVLGVPDDETWPGLSSTPFATEVLPELDVQRRRNRLRELFPGAMLSEEGFDVLDGLLACNPDKRLTAAAALKLSWFAKVESFGADK